MGVCRTAGYEDTRWAWEGPKSVNCPDKAEGPVRNVDVDCQTHLVLHLSVWGEATPLESETTGLVLERSLDDEHGRSRSQDGWRDKAVSESGCRVVGES
jgi:hypothetical protein